eukprot:Anaeramoba_ignava/c7101_g1_i2.p2 GENE.c7101_g1_i2~~c7101_g1_i2.p2  ORF type:complete len:213 (+),score=52.75 c7101_g1_i2:835-1473(+)
MQVGVHVKWIYLSVLCFLVFGLILYLIRIYRRASRIETISAKEFIKFFRKFPRKIWEPKVRPYALTMMVNMFSVSLFSPGVILYIFGKNDIFFSGTSTKMAYHLFVTIYDAGFFIGDLGGRKLIYRSKKNYHPAFFLILNIIGIGFGVSHLSELAITAGIFIALGNGIIYSLSCRNIDEKIDRKYNLIGLSYWLFVGDIGSVIGSNLISFIS